MSIARNGIPDIIIADIMMPKMNGYEVCKRLKGNSDTTHIPIILLTARADAESRLTGIEAGADAYIVKPFKSEEVLTRINALLKLREKLREKYLQIAITTTSEAYEDNPDEQFISKVKRMMEEHLDEESYDINSLSVELNMSRTVLFRKLKALTGLPPFKLFTRLRLNKAKELLLKSELNVTQIGYEVGFKNPSTFSRAFNKEFGLPPSKLKQAINSAAETNNQDIET
jgi:YesN/AraC family two-component response regulator